MIKKVLEKLPHIFLGLYILEFTYFTFGPYDRATWFVENLPVVLAVLLLAVTFKKFRFSNLSYFLMWFFLSYHTIGGHFTFERVPFDFFNNLINYLNFDFLFPEGRNNFDRIGHFMVGVFAYPFAEFVWRKKYIISMFFATLVGVFAIGFWAAAYEVIEMYFAVIYGGEAGQSFLGSQGDIWDAQKDMLLDMMGAVFAGVLFWFNYKKK